MEVLHNVLYGHFLKALVVEWLLDFVLGLVRVDRDLAEFVTVL